MDSIPLPESLLMQQQQQQLQEIKDPADMKKIFSAHFQPLPTRERLEAIMMIVTQLESKAEHTLKMMWALCEVVKEGKLWSPKFESFDEFKSQFPFGHYIDLMLTQHEYLDKSRKASARTIVERWQCAFTAFLPPKMMPDNGKISNGMLKLLGGLARIDNIDQQKAWAMIGQTIEKRRASASSMQLKHRNGSNYVQNATPTDIKAVVRKLRAVPASSSASASTTSTGKTKGESASRITLADSESKDTSSDDQPESPPRKRKRRAKNLPSQADHGVSSGRTRTSVVVPVSQAPREFSPSDECQCAPSLRRIWPLDMETTVEIPSLDKTVLEIMRTDPIVLCKFHSGRCYEALLLGIQQQRRQGRLGDTGSSNSAMHNTAGETAALEDSGASKRSFIPRVGTALLYFKHRKQSLG